MGLKDFLKEQGILAPEPEEDKAPAHATPILGVKPLPLPSVPASNQSTVAPQRSLSVVTRTGTVNQAQYEVLKKEVIQDGSKLAEFFSVYNSPLSKRITSQTDRFEATLETVGLSKQVFSQIVSDALLSVDQEHRGFVTDKEADKNSSSAAIQRQLLESQGNAQKLQDGILEIQAEAEKKIAQIKQDMDQAIGRNRALIDAEQQKIGPLQAQITELNETFEKSIVDFDASVKKLSDELQALLQLSR